MTSTNTLRLLAAVLVATVLPATAQSKLMPVDCRILCFQRADEATELVTWGAQANSEAVIPLSTAMPSQAVRVGAVNNTVRFFRKATAEEVAPGKTPPAPKPVAVVTLPENASKALLFFVPEKHEDGTLYTVMALDEVSERFPGGGAFVCNLHKADVRFLIGENTKQLGPKQTLYLGMPKDRDNFNMARVAFQFMDAQGQWRTATETRLRFTPGLRQILVTFLDPASGRPRMRAITDTPPAGHP